MLLGHIYDKATFKLFLNHPIWKKALHWIQKESPNKPDGEYKIDGRTMYASVASIETLPRSQGFFESHKKYIDLHYCLEGGEIIEWTPIHTLKPTTEYNREKDFILYESPVHTTQLRLLPGMFAIFLPADGHMPKIRDGKNKIVKKIVVKINTDFLESGMIRS